MQLEDSIAVLRYVMTSDTATEDHPYFVRKTGSSFSAVSTKMLTVNADVDPAFEI